MKHVGQRIIAILVRLVGFLSSKSSPKQRLHYARILAWLLMTASAKRFQITCENIRKAYPTWSPQEIDGTAKESYRNFALCFIELFATPRLTESEVDAQFDLSQAEVLKAEEFVHAPIIIISGHFGNWEWGVQALARYLNRDILSIAKPQRNSGVDQFVNRCRTTSMTRIVSMHEAAKEIIARMRGAGLIGMLIDQAADPVRDVFVEFFGRPAVCFEAPASLALRYNARIVCAMAERKNAGQYVVHIKPIDIEDLRNETNASQAISQRCTTVLENFIRLKPEQWSWQHRRWKYEPREYLKG